MVAVESGTAPTPEIALETDELGRFQLALPDGEFVVAAHTADGRSGRCSVVGESADELQIEVGDPPPADA